MLRTTLAFSGAVNAAYVWPKKPLGAGRRRSARSTTMRWVLGAIISGFGKSGFGGEVEGMNGGLDLVGEFGMDVRLREGDFCAKYVVVAGGRPRQVMVVLIIAV